MDRLYLTQALTLLGGQEFETLIRGASLPTPAGFRLAELHFDSAAPEGSSQLFQTLVRA